ncbi:MAG: hypothetical protein ACK4LQ_05945 [Pararhodobacter sp.]
MHDVELPGLLLKGRATGMINAAMSGDVIEWSDRRVGSMKTRFNTAAKCAGIAHYMPHDLPRTAGRFMAETGVPMEEIVQYLDTQAPISRAQFGPNPAQITCAYRLERWNFDAGPVQKTKEPALKSL